MSTIKKLAVIIITILLSGSGLLFGCQSLYSKMELELSEEEIILYLNAETETIVEETETDLEEGETELEETEEDFGVSTLFTATINNLPKNVSNNVFINQTIAGIVTVEETEKEEDSNTVTYKVSALKAGTTTLTVRTEEGNKTASIKVTVIEEIEDLEINVNYNPMVVVGVKTAINTAQALIFTPNTTNEKDVVYSLLVEDETATVTESGYITVIEKTSDYITVRATSVQNDMLYTDLNVRVIEPILLENISLKLEETPVNSVVLASNLVEGSQATYKVEVADNNENLNITLTVNTRSNLEIEKLTSTEFLLRSIELGSATLTAKVEVIGYESYFVTKNFDVQILEYPTYININGISGQINNVEIFDKYVSALGTPFVLSVGAVGAYNKQMKLQLSEGDREKIEIRYSDGSLVDIDSALLPNNITIYIKAKVNDLGEVVGSVASLNVVSYASMETPNMVDSTLNMLLKKGADDLTLTSPQNLSIEQGEEANISFEAVPTGASLGTVSLYVINSGIVEYTKTSSTSFKIRGTKVGNTRITLVSANGINKNIEVEVYRYLEDVTLDMYSPSESVSVAKVTKTITENDNNTLSDAVIAVGAGIPLKITKYPSDASVVSIYYTSSDPVVATISASGYIVAKSLGTTTILVRVGKNVDRGEGQSEIEYIERTFTLTVYMPIISTQLNFYQYELYDSNMLGYYEMSKGMLQLELNINPINASQNQNSIIWTTNSSYATVTSSGLVTVSLPAEINLATVTITATINEYGRYYTQKCVISVKKPIKVTGISILNVEDYLYFDARNGLGEENILTNSFSLNAKAYPTNASNSTLIYKYVQNANDNLVQPVVIVKSDGTIIPNRAGNAKIYIISQDSFTSADEYSLHTVLDVRVADGESDETAIELRSAQDLIAINTEVGLTLHYVISRTIDLTGVILSPIGIIDGEIIGFSGVISGDFTPFGYEIENQIIGANFNVNSTNRTNYVGLFALLNGGTIKNLTFKVNNFSLNLFNNNTGTISYIGPLVAKVQMGTIENVKVELSNSDIELSTLNNYIGGIAGFNSSSGQITSSKVWGELTVAKRQTSAPTEPTIYIGGMIGYNTGTVEADFDVTNEALIESYSSFNSNIIIKTSYMLNVSNVYGGIAGYNTGMIRNITTNSSVDGYYNVGGAVGYNAGGLTQILSCGFVKGVNNVGGLVGSNASDIESSLVLILDQFVLSEVVTPQIQGVNNVGGLVGYTSSSNISYSYVRSFYTRTIDNLLYFGDIVVNIPEGYLEEIYVGGLIGLVDTATLNTVYAHLNMVINDKNNTGVIIYAGGLIGGNIGLLTVQNAYAKGTLSSEGNAYVAGIIGLAQNVNTSIQKTYSMLSMSGSIVQGIVGTVNLANNFDNSLYLDTSAPASTYGTAVTLVEMQTIGTYTINNFGFVSLGGSPFEIDANYNDSTPYMLYSNNVTKMLIQAPTSLTITVNDGIQQLNEVENNYFKIDDKKAIVYYYQNASQSLNTYSIDDTESGYNPIIEKFFIPTTVNVELVGFTTSDGSIARVTTNGLLEVYKEGVVTITIYSILDKNVYDTFEVAVIKPITTFGLYEDIGAETLDKLGAGDIPIMKKEALKRIYPVISANIDDVEYSYNNLISIYYETVEQVGISFEDFVWSGDEGAYYTSIPYSEAQVLRADYASYLLDEVKAYSLLATPVMEVIFSSGTEILSLDFLQQEFSIKVVEGSTNLELSSYESNISLKDIFILDITLETDISNTSVIDIESIARVTSDEAGSVDALSELTLRRVNREVIGNIIYERYEIEVANKYDKELYSAEQTYIITFASYDKSIDGVRLEGEPASLTTQFVLNIIPQEVYRVDMNYYAANEIFEYENNAYYNPNELPSTSIIAGKIGLLKLAIYPEYSNIDYVDLVYYTDETFNLSLEQVAYVYDEETDTIGYTAIYPQSELISNGIRLRLISNREGESTYTYNGNLYIRILIASGVTTNTQFTLQATTYTNLATGAVKAGLSTSLTLGVQPASQVQISYLGESEQGYIAIGTEQTLMVAVSKLNVENPSGIKWILNNILESDITFVDEILVIDYITYYKFSILVPYSASYDFTQNITLQAMVERTINNNLEQYKSNILTLVPALFTIDSISVENVSGDNYYTAAYGGSYPLKVIINASYSESASNAQNEIDILQDELSNVIATDINNTSTWYSRLYNALGTEDSMLVLGDTSYINYIIKEKDGKIFIQPKRVSSGDLLVVKICIAYYGTDYSGIPFIVLDDLSSKTLGIDTLNQITIEYEFKTDFYLRTEEEKPIPIYTEEDLIEMQEGANYILMNDLVVGLSSGTPWTPLTTAIHSLDGNSYTITIQTFAVNSAEDTNIPNIKNFGLFENINSGTILKNVTVDLTNVVINATLYEQVYFGGITALNSGTLYNCFTTSGKGIGESGVTITMGTLVNNKNTIAYIGGLTAQNSGYITNSRSELQLEANKGYVAGISAYNSGSIASSYYKNGYIKNTSQTKLNSAIGGLVVYNTSSGKIRYSYVEGNRSLLEEDLIDFITGRILGGGLEFSGDFAGFIYENSGLISDCYSNIKITSQSRSSGFVFNNKGIIKNSYSMSKVAYNVAAHTPFTGTNEQGIPLTDANTITNCYYLAGDFGATMQEIATPLLKNPWKLSSSFIGLSFSESSDVSYGIWAMTGMINPGNPDDIMIYPSLVSANTIAESKQELDSIIVNDETGEITYNYVDAIGYDRGSEINPRIIQNSAQFNNILSESGTLFKQHVRIIQDFSFDIGETSSASNVDFAGSLDGNGMTISNISIVSSSETTTSAIGLFRSILGGGENIGLVKNLNLKFDEVFANDKVYVGGLAGIIDSGKIYDLTINSPSTVIQGKNLVGGVVGKVTGDSHLVNVEVSVSINASFRETVSTNTAYDIYDGGTNDTLICYSGAIAGIVDASTNGKINNIKVTGQSSIIGETVGGAFGLLGTNTTVNTILIEVVKEQFLRTTKVAGGIVGENRGTLNDAIIRHTEAVQTVIDASVIAKTYGLISTNQNTTFFAGIGQTIGGVVGFNNGGNITDVVSKIDVRNSNVLVAGGLVGRTVGGTITNSSAYGSVLSKQAVGGLIGAVTTGDLLAAENNALIKAIYRNMISSNKLTINTVKSYNNWLGIDYDTLVNGYSQERIVIGGLIGVIQSVNGLDEVVLGGVKQDNKYINSLYNPEAYTLEANWRLINEYGLVKESLDILYNDSVKLSDLSGNTNKKIVDLEGEENDVYVHYTEPIPDAPTVNETNIIGFGIKIFEITNYYS